jgi:hypothetical protein
LDEDEVVEGLTLPDSPVAMVTLVLLLLPITSLPSIMMLPELLLALVKLELTTRFLPRLLV